MGIIVIIAIYLIYIVYKWYSKGEITNVFTNEPIIINEPKTDTSGTINNTYTTPTIKTNFELICFNLKAKPNENNIVSVYFNDGKNIANVYSNGRFFVYNSLKQFITKGSYKEGGKELYPDYGTPYKSSNVLNNFKGILPKQGLTTITTYS